MRKPDIVILHGWGLSSQKFAPLAASLHKRGYRVEAPDLPGFGKTPLPLHALTLKDYAQYVHAFVVKSGLKNPVFIGHSFGGRVTLRYQQLYPADVSALVLTGTPGFTPVSRRRLLIFIAIAKVGNWFFSLPLLNLIQDQVRRWYYYVVGARDFYRAEGTMRETFKQIVQENLVSAMKVVRQPTLLLWGEEDIIVPVAIARRMEALISGAKLVVIPHADHGVPFKQPDVFATYVEEFLKKL